MIYLNNAAGSRPYPEVIKTITDVLQNYWGNPHDSTAFGHDAQMIIDNVTNQVADDINCNPSEIIWTSGAAEANSLAIIGMLNKNKDMHFCTTFLEHTSINEIIKDLPNTQVCFVSNDNCGYVNISGLKSMLEWHASHNIKTLISISYANSEVGVIQHIKEIAELIHMYNGILHVDATQALPWLKIDVQNLGIDMMSVSCQKIHGVKGVGFLYVKNDIDLKPLIYGSQQEGRRGGSMPTHLIAAFGKALELTRVHNSIEYVTNLKDKMLNKLLQTDGVHLNGPKASDRLANNISLTIDDVDADMLVTMCSLLDVYIAKGSACKSYEPTPSQALLAIGLTEEQALNTIRISLDEFNTEEEIDRAIDIIKQLIEQIRNN